MPSSGFLGQAFPPPSPCPHIWIPRLLTGRLLNLSTPPVSDMHLPETPRISRTVHRPSDATPNERSPRLNPSRRSHASLMQVPPFAFHFVGEIIKWPDLVGTLDRTC